MVSGIHASERLRAVLDQRWLRVTPRVANVNDERNPAVVDDSLESEPGRCEQSRQCNVGM